MLADAIAKFWIMPRTGTASKPVDSAAAGVTATKGFDLALDLIGGLPELDEQIGGAMVGTSGQARAEYVATAVRDDLIQLLDGSERVGEISLRHLLGVELTEAELNGRGTRVQKLRRHGPDMHATKEGHRVRLRLVGHRYGLINPV